MKNLNVVVLVAVLSGCVSGYQQFYKPYVDIKTLSDIESLKENEAPKIYTSNNMDADGKSLVSKGYIALGYSSFNGEYEKESALISQARKVGAAVVLTGSTYTNTETKTTPVLMPTTSTTTQSGSVYGYGGSASYNGSATTYGNTVVPMTTSHKLYNQTAVFFVKSTKKMKFGAGLNNLSPEQRAQYQRNTGVFVEVVMENTPAFNANLLEDDLIIEVDKFPVNNVEGLLKILEQIDTTKTVSVIVKVIRKSEEKNITVTYN